MAFRAAVSVLLGGNFNQASKLLSAAERGEERQVKEVRFSRPGASKTGFATTTKSGRIVKTTARLVSSPLPLHLLSLILTKLIIIFIKSSGSYFQASISSI